MSLLDTDPSIEAFPDPAAADHVRYDPDAETLRALAGTRERTTSFGAPAYVSETRSRCADRTANAVDEEFDAEDWGAIDEAIAAANDAENDLVCVDRRLGRHPDLAVRCRLFVPERHARIALAWSNLLEPCEPGAPDFVTIQLPDREETRIRVLPDQGVTCVLGSDYTGEAKKSFLRLFMNRAKQRGGLGLHAGSKLVTLTSGENRRSVGQLFLGLSGTGKSTLTGHGYGLEPPESAVMLQDDVCALLPDGTVAGSEGAGLFVKTIGLDPDEQPALHGAVTHDSAVLENVAVAPDGTVDFDDDGHTANGRTVIRRDHLATAAAEIDLDRVDQVFFITRNPLMPPVAKLDAAEAAAAFMLGESIETSAGDPSRAGERVRVVGTNPFIIGAEGAEGNRFHDLVDALDVECYLLNTGTIGEDGPDITVDETVGILRALARGRVTWTRDDTLGLQVPVAVPGTDVDSFYPPDRIADFDRRYRALRAEREEYLAGFEALRSEIVEACY